MIRVWRRLFGLFLRPGISPRSAAERMMEMLGIGLARFSPADKLRFLFELENRLYAQEGACARMYEGGIHPKHRLTGYHDYFVRNLRAEERVLDVGCGNGLLCYEMVSRAGVTVYGIDRSEKNIAFARSRYRHARLAFAVAEAPQGLPRAERFDVVTLSNLLEHIPDRAGFLRSIMSDIRPQRLIVRVPLFDRDWRVPLKKELGVDYRLDPTHCTEYTREEFLREIAAAGLAMDDSCVRWGELWCVLKPEVRNRDA